MGKKVPVGRSRIYRTVEDKLGFENSGNLVWILLQPFLTTKRNRRVQCREYLSNAKQILLHIQKMSTQSLYFANGFSNTL